jgi:SAM-dependent MidA family methyltransferase
MRFYRVKVKCEILILVVIFLLSSNVLAVGSLLSENCLSPNLKIQAEDFSAKFAGFFNDQDSDNIRAQLDAFNAAQRYFAEKIIAQGGKITFAEFMQDALYSEHGFFTNHAVVGRDQSFDTYAENVPFGYALAKQITEMWEKMGKPDKFSIVEMGAGSGALVKNIIAYIQQNEPALFKSLDYVIVEISPKLKKAQEETLEKEFSSLDNVPVRWSKGTAFDLSKLKDIEGIFLSNEMPDNFPIHRVKKVQGQIKEIYTVFKDGKFQDEAGPIASQDLQDYVDSLEVEIKEGVEVPVNLNLRIWQENLGRALKKGFVITIDYGGKIEEVTQNPYAVWNKETNAIEDNTKKMEYIYKNCGSCDITAEVNFYDIADWGRKNGLQVQGYTLQRDFLWNMDFDGISDDLTRKGVIIPRRKSIANDIATNFHFKVLIQSKNVDQGIELQGLDSMEDLYQPYSKNIDLILSIGPEQSEFIVITNDVNFNKEIIRKGKQSIKDNIGNGYGFGGKTQIIEANDLNVENGKYIISLSRQELLDITIYNEQGQVLFRGWDYFKNQGKGKKLSIGYEEFEQKYLTNFDLTNMQSDIIPDMFYLHQDGSLQIFSPEFLLGQLDKQLSPQNSLNQKIEQAI